MSLVSSTRDRTSGSLDVVTLRLGQDTLAIRAGLIREVLEPVAITRVPGAPEFCTGLVNVRGTVVPLADLRVIFGMHRGPVGPDTRILVLDLSMEGRAAVVGIIADAVHEVTRISQDSLQDVPAVGTSWPAQFVEAIANRDSSVVMIPDLPAIFASALSTQATPVSSHSGGTQLPPHQLDR
ncbi:chemotaxis protein CheW [Rubellimicrobium arenae]|uniref:chemotaxis protein CheW n=1 Tax=Rubellimicrobium arenae TaxID=2817372 RepID=UPI001B30325F|nr:chemotaxis protein CheW [Rubellimicrobium arenae]